jgi:mannitol/fructose-specific phosphotransferase system IIA component
MTERHVLLNRSYASRDDVLGEIGAVMVSTGAVTPAYVEGMRRKEDQGCTTVLPDVALPHGTFDVRSEVRRNALVVVQVPAGVDWGNGRRVRLVIGFAGAGDNAHIRLLSNLARVLGNQHALATLKTTTDIDVARRLLESPDEPIPGS